MLPERRQDDERMMRMEKMMDSTLQLVIKTDGKVAEIHQRQLELISPKVDSLDKAINGNGSPGLKGEVGKLKTTVGVLKWGIPIALTIFGIVLKYF